MQTIIETYSIIYILKIVESLALHFANPIISTFKSHVSVGHVRTLAYNSSICLSLCLFNRLPMHLRSISSCSVFRIKTQLDIFLGIVEDLLYLP